MPTMNKIDLLDCANGHHNFDGGDECTVCGITQETAGEERLYQIDVPIWATAYIKAPDAATAMRMAVLSLAGKFIEVYDAGGDVPVCGADFDSPTLPTVSLSPAMTICDREVLETCTVNRT